MCAVSGIYKPRRTDIDVICDRTVQLEPPRAGEALGNAVGAVGRLPGVGATVVPKDGEIGAADAGVRNTESARVVAGGTRTPDSAEIGLARNGMGAGDGGGGPGGSRDGTVVVVRGQVVQAGGVGLVERVVSDEAVLVAVQFAVHVVADLVLVAGSGPETQFVEASVEIPLVGVGATADAEDAASLVMGGGCVVGDFEAVAVDSARGGDGVVDAGPVMPLAIGVGPGRIQVVAVEGEGELVVGLEGDVQFLVVAGGALADDAVPGSARVAPSPELDSETAVDYIDVAAGLGIVVGAVEVEGVAWRRPVAGGEDAFFAVAGLTHVVGRVGSHEVSGLRCEGGEGAGEAACPRAVGGLAVIAADSGRAGRVPDAAAGVDCASPGIGDIAAAGGAV